MKTQRAIVTDLSRLTNTPSGNPRWLVHTNVGSYRTEPDSQVASLLSPAWVDKVVDLTLQGSAIRKIEEVSA